MTTNGDSVHHRSSVAAKIALFRSLFRGREDVYPRRFESRKTGRCGYQPACANEWARGLCQKPKVKCSACPHRRLLPVTDDAICRHLSGQDADGRPFVMGIYPMLQDETCFFLAVDFDKTSWQEDVDAFGKTCQQWNLPIVMERSRSGNGAARLAILRRGDSRRVGAQTRLAHSDRNDGTAARHRFGFLRPIVSQSRHIAARRFRQSDCVAASKTTARTRQQRLYTEARGAMATVSATNGHFFRPFGRRIATPWKRLYVMPRRRGVSWECDSPWQMKMTTHLGGLPPSRCRKEPPIVGPLPKSMELVLGDQIYIAKESLPPGLRNRLVRLAAFQNPEFYKAQAMRLPTYDKPRIIGCAEDHPQHIGLPRGCLDDVQSLLADLDIEHDVRDERNAGKPLGHGFPR